MTRENRPTPSGPHDDREPPHDPLDRMDPHATRPGAPPGSPRPPSPSHDGPGRADDAASVHASGRPASGQAVPRGRKTAAGPDTPGGHPVRPLDPAPPRRAGGDDRRARAATSSPAETGGHRAKVTLRGPADLVDALPYLLGFRPDDSVVMLGLRGADGRFGVRLRAGIPAPPGAWQGAARHLADRVVNGAGPNRGPDAVVLFLCQEPRPGEDGRAVKERLRPLAQQLRIACGALDVPVVEALCVAAGRWWSYTCPSEECCPADGTGVDREGTSVMAAAAAYAGIRVSGSLREMEGRLAPVRSPAAARQIRALDEASADLVPRMLADGDSEAVKEETVTLSGAALARMRAAPTGDDLRGDAHDDGLLGDDEAATIILGLQDRETRDRAAEWMEGEEAAPALRLWRALARRCVGAYAGHAAAPLTLAGWVAWSMGDEAFARVALHRALDADPGYTFAHLLSQACDHGLDPEPLRRCLREERGKRLARSLGPGRAAKAGTRPKGRPRKRAAAPSGPGAPARPRRRAADPEEGPGC